jgi:hypothetical protein
VRTGCLQLLHSRASLCAVHIAVDAVMVTIAIFSRVSHVVFAALMRTHCL